MLFIANKYTAWYNLIIARAQSRSLSCYTEKHHIVPKSLGGSNSKSNLVSLTPREHFICHWLLTKMVAGESKQKMTFALWRMSVPTASRHKLTSTQYARIREEFSKANSIRHTGKVMPADAVRRKAAKQVGSLNHFYGKSHTEKAKQAISIANKGRKHTADELEKMSKSHLGESNGSAKLSETQVKEIRRSTLPTLELAAVYGVSRSLIYKIKDRSVWPHISD